MSTPNALLAASLMAVATHAAVAQQLITKNAKVAPDVTVEVSNVQGSVVITAWDKNEVDLLAELESSKDELEYEASERHVRIEVRRPQGKYDSHEDNARLTLRVPKRASIVADTVSADIEVAGIRGELGLQSVSGTVETQAYEEPVKATTVSGDITIMGNGGMADVSTDNVSGTSTVTGVGGRYEGEVVSGEIRASVASAERVQINSVSGDIDLAVGLSAASRLALESVSGTIAVRIKPPVNADFDIESFSGGIENCFGPKARDTSKHAPGSVLSFMQGNGDARVEIQTLSGDISVCDD